MKSGVTANDRELGAEVRRMSLKKVRKILSDDYEDKDYQKAVLLKLVPTLLPRLNEHSGEGGEPLTIKIINYGDRDSTSLHTETIPNTLPASDGQQEEKSDNSLA